MPWVEAADHLDGASAPEQRARCLRDEMGPLPAASGHSRFDEALEPFQAGYVWLWKGAPVAFSRLDFTHQRDDLWVYSSSSEPRGIGHLYPIRPKLESTMRITERRAAATPEGHAAAARVTTRTFSSIGARVAPRECTRADDRPAVTPGVQDDLSVQIAMIRQLLLGQTPRDLREIDKNGIRDYLYKRVGEEMLDTAARPRRHDRLHHRASGLTAHYALLVRAIAGLYSDEGPAERARPRRVDHGDRVR